MKSAWTVLKRYDADHLTRIALPLGGIGTGTVSLSGRGGLRDWELMNRPAKGYVPRGSGRDCVPGLVLSVADGAGRRQTRLLEGPLEHWEYEGASGCAAPNHGLPRFRDCSFETSYPFGRVLLKDEDLPVTAAVEGFNPMIPADPARSSLPAAVLRVVVTNPGPEAVDASVCFNLPNFIGDDGRGAEKGRCNVNTFRAGDAVRGIAMAAGGVDPKHEAWGTMALTTPATEGVHYRTAWRRTGWGTPLLHFWDEFSASGTVTDCPADEAPSPMASLVVRRTVAGGQSEAFTFLLTWRFPNRRTWTPRKASEGCGCGDGCGDPDIIGNHYCTVFEDAWAAAERVGADLEMLEADTVRFVNAFVASALPEAVKEGALFNLSTLRSQTVFQTPDGLPFGWEGCCDGNGCCHGSCTHVWNYETSTAFLFGEMARRMREVEFQHATGDDGLMAFRVNLPIERAREYGRAAADGQMGCVIKCYREWQLSGDASWLKRLWPRVKAALAFCWIPGGWDADGDGVMEGCQHNTMDVEYFGPNPQMQGWYLGALRAAEAMAVAAGDERFAETCREKFAAGRAWMDANLFNGEYYVHEVRPLSAESIADGLHIHGKKAVSATPEYQLAEGCLVDQLVGQCMAHVCGLGYLHDAEKVRTTLRSILRYNRRAGMHDHFNCMRSYALGDETALLMAAYPGERPANPFPYFTEVMTGFEWTAAVGMLYEGLTEEGLGCIAAIRARYNGRRRNPFDEAECGHHYARAMAAWSAVLALTGFHYSAVSGAMRFGCPDASVEWFWAAGDAWGTCALAPLADGSVSVRLEVMGGTLRVETLAVGEAGVATINARLDQGAVRDVVVRRG